MKRTNPLSSLLKILTFFTFFFLLLHVLGMAIDSSIDRQNAMLCNSAKVSGNAEYLKKCQRYYKTGDIIYLRTQ